MYVALNIMNMYDFKCIHEEARVKVKGLEFKRDEGRFCFSRFRLSF